MSQRAFTPNDDAQILHPRGYKRGRAKSSKRHTTDQNYLCRYRFNKYIYCKGIILPASQTATVWRMEPPDVRDGSEVPESFRGNDDVQAEVKVARDAVRTLVDDYENDWRTQAEREDLLRGPIEQTEQLRSLDPIHESPAIMCGQLARPSRELEDHWNAVLRQYGLQPEVDFYPSQLVHRDHDRQHSGSDEDDDRDAGFEADGISYAGVRRTVGDSPNDHQERKHWLPLFRSVLNEEGWTYGRWVPEGFTDINAWTPEREAEIRNHPRFRAFVALYQVFFCGRSIAELNINKDPNTVAQALARAREIKSDYISDSDRQKSIGHYVCTVMLNNRRTNKILAPLNAPVGDAVKALNKERLKAQRKAIDNATQQAKAKRLSKEATEALVAEALKRIDKAYEGVLVMADRGITVNDLDPATPADVIFSAISEGQGAL